MRASPSESRSLGGHPRLERAARQRDGTGQLGAQLLARTPIVLLAALACAGCGETSGAVMSPGAGIALGSGLAVPSAAAASYGAGSVDDGSISAGDRQQLAQRSMASRVTAAIALERVTGRKPDPGRLATVAE